MSIKQEASKSALYWINTKTGPPKSFSKFWPSKEVSEQILTFKMALLSNEVISNLLSTTKWSFSAKLVLKKSG